MNRLQRILVGMTNTKADHDLLRYAGMVAHVCGTQRVCFTHVLPSAARAREDDNLVSDRHRAAAALEAAVRAHFPEAANIQTRVEVLKGPLVDRLLDFTAEQEVDLVLLGRGRDWSGRRSLARRLAMSAPCSVWMVPEGSPAALRRLLVPVDFSEHAAHALRLAASLAHLAGGAHCIALHVPPTEPMLLHEELDTFQRGREREEYRRWVASVGGSDVEIEPLLEEGWDVAETVLRVAAERQADLVVMGTRGRSPSASILLGSAAEQTIIASSLPVLAVKEFGARINVLKALLGRSFQGV
jgi:nucleotide-binding universal stress UspA family protein